MREGPKRHWFSFSLRTLFVAMTLFGVWLGYELNWIRKRHAIIERCLWAEYEAATNISVPNPKPSAPGMLWLFGERGRYRLNLCFEVEMPRPLTADEERQIDHAKRLFPEAAIVEGQTFTPVGPELRPRNR